MASMKFIVKNDKPECFKAEGSVLELVALISYQAGKVYSMLHNQDPMIADIFRATLAQAISDTESSTWNTLPKDDGVGHCYVRS